MWRAPPLDLVGWHWSGGKTTLLKAPAGTVAMPSAISDTGRIVGAVASDDDGAANPTSGEAPEQAASWASTNAPAKILPALAGDVGAHAYGVNKNGIAVGNSQATDHFTPVVWDAGGHVTALPGLGGGFGIARAIDDSGVAVGDVVPASGDPEAVTWDVGHHPTSHGKAKGRNTQATGLVHGRAVGQTAGAGVRWCRPAASRAVGRRGHRHDPATAAGRPRGGHQRRCRHQRCRRRLQLRRARLSPADDVDVRVVSAADRVHEPRLVRLRLPVIVLVALAVVGLAAWVPASWSPPTASAATSTFSFGVAGDFGQTDSSTGAVLNAVKSSGTNMMFGIGDFSYVAAAPSRAGAATSPAGSAPPSRSSCWPATTRATPATATTRTTGPACRTGSG